MPTRTLFLPRVLALQNQSVAAMPLGKNIGPEQRIVAEIREQWCHWLIVAAVEWHKDGDAAACGGTGAADAGTGAVDAGAGAPGAGTGARWRDAGAVQVTGAGAVRVTKWERSRAVGAGVEWGGCGWHGAPFVGASAALASTAGASAGAGIVPHAWTRAQWAGRGRGGCRHWWCERSSVTGGAGAAVVYARLAGSGQPWGNSLANWAPRAFAKLSAGTADAAGVAEAATFVGRVSLWMQQAQSPQLSLHRMPRQREADSVQAAGSVERATANARPDGSKQTAGGG
ncbi:hypothetical protein GGX14DRAFT_408423, partial [Mycena pura]